MSEPVQAAHEQAVLEPLAAPRKPTLAVDFDGVLHAYTTPWEATHVIPDTPVVDDETGESAIAWLLRMTESFQVVVHTARAADASGELAIRLWLADNGYDGPPLRVTAVKPPALAYVDDRGWRFEGRFPTEDEIRAVRQWNLPDVEGP
jgi:hypothetical protein